MNLLFLAAAYAAFLPTVPGATNPQVTQADIATTVCKSGWTKTVRPPVSYTNKIKAELMAKYHLPGTVRDYELDHDISLQLGGSPTSLDNLWMEPYAGPEGARRKDIIETKLKRLICSGKLPLAAAQHAITTDWVQAYVQYVGPLPGVVQHGERG